MRIAFWIGIAAVCVAALIFGFQNRETVTISFIGWSFRDVSVGLLAFTSLVIGVTFTALVAFVESATLRWERRRLRRELEQLRARLEPAKPAPEDPPTVPSTPPLPPDDQTR